DSPIFLHNEARCARVFKIWRLSYPEGCASRRPWRDDANDGGRSAWRTPETGKRTSQAGGAMLPAKGQPQHPPGPPMTLDVRRRIIHTITDAETMHAQLQHVPTGVNRDSQGAPQARV